jgi:predicted ATPase/class 3 adenylate cyclase
MNDARDLPAGTVTFLFTDVEGSTTLLGELGADSYAEALDEHRRLLRAAFESNKGVEVDTQGDAFLVAFARASDALAAAAEGQARLEHSGLRVRMGLHTGEPVRTSEGYVGMVVHKAARIAAAGHGGQIVLSQATRDLAEVDAEDLGQHRLKDLEEPLRLYQLGEGSFPPLRSLSSTNLPVPATPFIGREEELEEVVALLGREDVHLVTLTGPGGSGKTRLALQAAAEASDRFPDGVTWVPLEPLRNPALVVTAVAQAVGVGEGGETGLAEKLVNALATRRTLLLLDNAEHLLPDAAADIGLLTHGSPVLLVTSRERLQLQGEHHYSVPTLSDEDGFDLFVARARAVDQTFEANGGIAELCARLENLPLALELAAARTSLFTPEQLLARLSSRLDLLQGGRDAEARQRTLRATIEWSHELLGEEERALVRRLSVFSGGCTYEAAEEVCDATPDLLQSLIDKSLLRRRQGDFGPRYWMLETVREYASEKLEESGEESAVQLRHAEWFCELAERLVGVPAERLIDDDVGSFPDEYDNARRAIAWAWESGKNELALRLGPACIRYWMQRALFREAIDWLEGAVPALADAPAPIGLDALNAAGVIAFWILADTDQAEAHWARARPLAQELGKTEKIAWIGRMLAGVAWERGELERALELHEEALQKARADGRPVVEADALHMVGEALRDLGRFDESEGALLRADAIYRRLGNHRGLANNVHSIGDLELDRGRLAHAAYRYRETLELDLRYRGAHGDRDLVYCLAGLACVLAAKGRRVEAAGVWGAVCANEHALGFRMIRAERRRYASRLEELESTPEWETGRDLTLEQAYDLVARALGDSG